MAAEDQAVTYGTAITTTTAMVNVVTLAEGDTLTAVTLTLADGRSFYAMCVIDAMGCAVTFHQPIEVRSVCKDTGEPVYLRLTPEDGLVHIEPDDQIIATLYDTMAHYVEFNC